MVWIFREVAVRRTKVVGWCLNDKRIAKIKLYDSFSLVMPADAGLEMKGDSS
uniref:Uncharacterized protein n=1 Tax=Spironucleus salmonicida TaxID=348837 RepID=V6LLR8_9EUKA|eukprot:EST45572.1 Hypothetical protein SS50377_14502 [Spironucleus salmonicida]